MGIFGIAAGSEEDEESLEEQENEEMVTVAVGPPATTSLATGATPTMLGGKQADGIVSELHGKYYTQNSWGNLFYGANAAAGAAFTIFSNATFVGLILWNPQGSGKNLSIVRASLALDTQASTAMAGWGYTWLINAGSGIATGAPFSAFTAITATRGSCTLGATGQGASVALLGSGATLTTAFANWRPANFSTSTGAITVAIAASQMSEELDGTMIVPPGVAVALTSNILSGFTASGGFIWEEVPVG